MQINENSTSLSEQFWYYLMIIRKWAWLIVLCTVIAGIATYYTSRLITPIYQSSTRLLINEAPTLKPNDYNAILTSERQARTYAAMITNRLLLENIIAELGVDLGPDQLANAITVALVRDTRLIDVTVENPNPTQAAAIANLIAEKFIAQLDTLEKARYQASKANLENQMALLNEQIESASAALSALGDDGDAVERDRMTTILAQNRQTYAGLVQSYEAVRLAEASTTSSVVQLVPAAPVNSPIRPRVLFNTILGAIAGGVLALLAMFVIEAMDDTLKTPEDIERALGLSVIGYIADIQTYGNGNGKKDALENNEKSLVHVVQEPRSPISDAFRALRTNLEFLGVDKPLRTLLVTSADPGDGKTTIATNLAAIFGQEGKQVILLDADLRKPNVHRMLKISNRVGLTNLLKEDINYQEVGSSWNGSKEIIVITSGSLPPNPTELLASAKMGRILDGLVEKTNLVVIDSAPSVVVDAQILAARVDGVLLVVKPGKTYAGSARAMLQQFNRAGARIVGVVMNQIPHNRGDYYYGKYHYYTTYHHNYDDQLQEPSLSGKFSLVRRWVRGRKG